jgi:hypothetical protein
MSRRIAGALALVAVLVIAAVPARAAADDAYEFDEIIEAAVAFFGSASEGLAKLIEKVFAEHGRPNAYITGEEISGALGVGLRYGKGELNRKAGPPRPVFWQGPSIGFDVGGNAAKAFVLVYNLRGTDQIFQRIPGVEGTVFFVAGFSVNYNQSGNLILAPIRTGVGWRAGANFGYLHFTRKHSWIPF